MRLLAAALFFIFSAAGAQEPTVRPGITLNPVRLDLMAGQRATSITVSNGSAEEKTFQVSPKRWMHVNGAEEYAPANHLIANPPLFRLAPGASQIVRIGTLKPIPRLEREETYRIYFEEVPLAQNAASSQLRLLLRFGVPLFIRPAEVTAQKLEWRASLKDGNTVRLQLQNHGNVHVRASDVALHAPGPGTEISKANGFAYLFAGETFFWELPLNSPVRPDRMRVTAYTGEGAVDAELPLQVD